MFNKENEENNLKSIVNDFSLESEKLMRGVNKVANRANIYATKNEKNENKTVNVYDVENKPVKNSIAKNNKVNI
jgi:hypothetical protein